MINTVTAVPKKTKAKREKSTSTKGHYVKNSDLLPAVIEAKEKGVVTDKLIQMIQLIAERYSRKSWFIGYSYREDMVSAAVENLCKNALKFDHLRYSNPFAFYTTAIRNSFLQYMADEKRHRNIRDKLLIEAGSNPSFNFQSGGGEDFYEPRDSDSFRGDLRIEMPDEDPLAKPLIVSENGADDVPVIPKELKHRFKDRAPGEVKKYGPKDLIIDPVTGAFTIKQQEEPAVKAAPKKRAAKKLAELPAVPTQLKTATKSAVAKKVTTKTAVTVKKTTATKKPVVKKAATPKKTATKKAK